MSWWTCTAVVFGAITVAWLALVIAYKTNARFKAFVKFSVYAVASVLLATTPIPLMFMRPGCHKNALFPAAGLRFVARHFLGIRCSVRGKEHLVADSGCVVVINHQSVVDLIALAELWPVIDRCTVISKKEIFYIWPFGLAAWLWGTIFIDRLNGARAKEQVNRTGRIIRARRARVLIFPEGKRSMEERLLPFKKGAFHLAIASQCPIQPVIVDRYRFLGKHRFDEGEMEINILPAIVTEGRGADDLPALIDETYHVMQTHLDLLAAKHAPANNNIDKSKHD